MTIIYAATNDQVLVATILPKLAQNNVNMARLHVDFDETWNDASARSAVFTTSKNPLPYEKILSTAGDCLIPPEVFADGECKLYITVKGVSTSGAVKTSTRLVVRVLGGTPVVVISDPSPSVYQQLLSLYSETNANIAVERARINNLLENSGAATDDEIIDIRVAADGTVYETAGEAIREQINATYRYPFIVLHGSSLVNFDTTNKTVDVPTFRAIGKAGYLDIERTVLNFATTNGMNVVYFKDGALGICITSQITTDMQPIFSFNSVSIALFVGCTLPVANYSVDGKTFFEYRESISRRYYNNGFVATRESPVAFDTVNKTVKIINDFRLQGPKQYVATTEEVVLAWDLTGNATNYVYMKGGTELICSSTAPTIDDIYLFAFFKGKLYLENRSGCTLPPHLYTVDGRKYNEEKIIVFDGNSNTPITIYQNTKIFGNGYELNLGTALNGTRSGNIVTVNYTPAADSHFHKTFVDRTEELLIENNRPYYNVTIWAFNGNKYEAIRLTPYLQMAEVEANDNSFTYIDGVITINSANYTNFVLAGEEDSGIAIGANVTVEIHDLKILFARTNCVKVNAGHVKMYNCEMGYATVSNGLAVQNADCDTFGCKAYFNRNDGFNYHYSGHSLVVECEGYNNFDDGVSHHEDCTFEINGGDWKNNGKGGIASPTYGAKGRISNVICRNNSYGIYAEADELVDEPCFINGAVVYGNTKGISSGNYILNVFNSTIKDNGTDTLTSDDGAINML